MDKVCIIIPVHNRLQFTIKCIQSLERLDYNSMDIVVIDDGSSDGTTNYLKNHFASVIILQGDGNLWWSGAVNKGIKYAILNQYNYILLLNNDNIVLDSGYLKNIVESSKTNENKIIGSVVKHSDNRYKFRFLGGNVSYWTGFIRLYDESVLRIGKDCFETEWLGGMGVLVPINYFCKFGLFDEKYFPHYSGDQDYWFKLQSHGIKLLIDKKCRISVFEDDREGAKGSKKRVYDLVSRKSHYNMVSQYRLMIRYLFKFYSPLSLILFYPVNLLYYYGTRKYKKI
jgi:GT2 family glycosyltransferase